MFDIDGVVADVRHRLHFLQRRPKDWPGFFAAAADDPGLAEGINRVLAAVDHYEIGDAKPGPITRGIQQVYFDVVRGKHGPYRHWLTSVYGNGPPRD